MGTNWHFLGNLTAPAGLCLVLAAGGIAAAGFLGLRLWNCRREERSLRAQLADAAKKLQAQERALASAGEAAAESERTKRDFLAVMSHEIRTPLGGVIGMLDLLRKLPQTAQQKHYTSLAHESSGVLLELVDDLLDIAKIEAGRLTLEKIPFRLRQELGRAVACIRPRTMAKGLELSCRIHDSVPEIVNGDPTRLRQVLGNLLSNALKFTASGSIRLLAEAEAGGGSDGDLRLRISVTDTGIGISPEIRARLFSRFEQGDVSTSRRFGGTGLGLAIARHIVELMGGRIWVESDVGKGATFTFEARLTEATAAEAGILKQDEQTKARPTHTRQLRVLCVDDEMINRVIAEGLVTSMGHTVEFAETAEQGFELLARHDYDTVLMDYRMPGMNGIQAARLIRSGGRQVRDPDIFIAAFSANSSREHRRECESAGLNVFVQKPIREDELHRALEQAIEFQQWRGRELPLIHDFAAAPAVALPRAHELSESELMGLLDAAASSRLDEGTARRKKEIQPEFVRQYLKDAPARLQQIQDAIAERNVEQIGLAAHSLKSISGYVAGDRLSALGGRIEDAADRGELDKIPGLTGLALAEFAALRTRLETLHRIHDETTIGG